MFEQTHGVPVFNFSVELLNYDLYPELYDGIAHVIAQELNMMQWDACAINRIVINFCEVELGFSGGDDYWFKMLDKRYTYKCSDFYDLSYAVLMHYCEQIGGTPLHYCETVV